MADSTDSNAPDSTSDDVGTTSGLAGNKEARRGSKSSQTKKILADADRRDEEAAARDIVADDRAEAADLEAFMDIGTKYPGHGERRAAAQDRAHSKSDREASADDRTHLVDDDDDGDAGK